ncbi:hypothetical protein TNCV_1088361 [Trichonephila clavipes]|uniref:Uncharacterized protein n=1 Tax=Trichonephila clavipes TaxID=2585209 RepID=A0A8X6VQZ3_TRICX|nr:hypothetical protein TNCV_1088361 [Trichonephila clavipes]
MNRCPSKSSPGWTVSPAPCSKAELRSPSCPVFHSRPEGPQYPSGHGHILVAGVFKSQIRVLMPLKTHRLERLMRAESVVAQSPPFSWLRKRQPVTSRDHPDRLQTEEYHHWFTCEGHLLLHISALFKYKEKIQYPPPNKIATEQQQKQLSD